MLKFLLLSVLAVAMIGLMVPSAFAEYQPTKLILDEKKGYHDSRWYAGVAFEFTGELISNGQPVPNAKIIIKQCDDCPTLASATTRADGVFFARWDIVASPDGNMREFKAYFEGDEKFASSKSNTIFVDIREWNAKVTLNQFQPSARVGEIITFSGNLELDDIYYKKNNEEGQIVYIMDRDTSDDDDLLATAIVKSDGSYSVDWRVVKIDTDSVGEIYALFYGYDIWNRVTTDISALRILDGEIPTNYQPPDIGSSLPPRDNLSGDEYFEYFYAYDFTRTPTIAISPSPTSYEITKKGIIPAQEGIMQLSNLLEMKHDGNWDVDFKIITPGETILTGNEDFVLNLVTRYVESDCGSAYGWVTPSERQLAEGNLNLYVCLDDRNYERIAGTSFHEFIHGMGVGHVWNKPGDKMCSKEGKD